MNIMEGNTLIAEFLGAEPCGIEWDLWGCIPLNDLFKDYDAEDLDVQHFFSAKEMKFHESWDWIKPAIDKIATSGAEDYFGDPLSNCSLYSEIELVYQSVIEFINWYNKQNEDE